MKKIDWNDHIGFALLGVIIVSIMLTKGCTSKPPQTPEGKMLLYVTNYNDALETLSLLRKQGHISDDTYRKIKPLTNAAKQYTNNWINNGVDPNETDIQKFRNILSQIVTYIVEAERKKNESSTSTSTIRPRIQNLCAA